MTTTAETRAQPAVLRRGLPQVARITAVVLFVLVTLAMALKFLHHDYKDAEVWYDVGRRVLEGESLLRLQHYRYPPTFAVLVAPLCLLPWPAFFFVWYALNCALFGLCARMAARLASPAPGPRLLWLPAAMAAIYAIDNLFLGQTNLVITALLYWTMRELVRGREWRAGIPLGLSIALKAFTFPWVLYLGYRGRVRALASTLVVCAVCLFLLPAPVRGYARNRHEVLDWGRRVVAPYLSRGQAGDWGQHALDFGNQSLQAVLHRLLTRTDANVIARHGGAIYVNVANLTEFQVNAVLLAAAGLLAAVFIAACGWLKPYDPRRYLIDILEAVGVLVLIGAVAGPSVGLELLPSLPVFLAARWWKRPRDSRQYATELAMSVIVLLLVSALAWTYFFVMLLLPFAVAVRLAGVQEATPLRPITRGALLLALWAQLPVAVSLVSADARAVGSVCWGAVLMYVALALAAWDLRRTTPAPSSRALPSSTARC